MSLRKILLLEPFYGGSHKVLMDLLMEELQTFCKEACDATKPLLITMTAKKWHWRARTSALYFVEAIPRVSVEAPGTKYGTIFCSSVLPLHELIAIRDDLRDCRKVVYFHENQLVYPVRKSQDRDFQYGYNQVMSCLAADVVLFNSAFNKESFLSSIQKFFRLQPDYRPKNLREQIEPKCEVLYFPMNFAVIPKAEAGPLPLAPNECISIVWPHRWEFDKNPELFFRVISRLVDDGVTNFRLSVLGESFTNNPPVFEEARLKLGMYIDNFGYLESKADYYGVLCASDVVISTAEHEFFGVAIMEAIYCGCYPLCPNKLVYPEILNNNQQCLYDSEDDLYQKLKKIISDPAGFRKSTKQGFDIDFRRFDWQYLKNDFMREILPRDAGC